MPFFVGSNLLKPPSIFLAPFFITINQGLSSRLIFQSFKTKFLPKVENIFFLESRSQFINDCLVLDVNSKAFKVKSNISFHFVSILSLLSFNFRIPDCNSIFYTKSSTLFLH